MSFCTLLVGSIIVVIRNAVFFSSDVWYVVNSRIRWSIPDDGLHVNGWKHTILQFWYLLNMLALFHCFHCCTFILHLMLSCRFFWQKQNMSMHTKICYLTRITHEFLSYPRNFRHSVQQSFLLFFDSFFVWGAYWSLVSLLYHKTTTFLIKIEPNKLSFYYDEVNLYLWLEEKRSTLSPVLFAEIIFFKLWHQGRKWFTNYPYLAPKINHWVCKYFMPRWVLARLKLTFLFMYVIFRGNVKLERAVPSMTSFTTKKNIQLIWAEQSTCPFNRLLN